MKQVFEINDSPWGHKFSGENSVSFCRAEVEFTENAIWVCMRANEKDLRMRVRDSNGAVYTDSCLEFFFSPCPDESAAYFNFELNPLGTLYTGYSPDGTRKSSAPINNEGEISVHAKACEERGEWTVCFTVPYEYIIKRAPGFDPENQGYIKGNFYKCADGKDMPHYLVWSHIDPEAVPEPDFHRPEYFGKICIK